MLVCVSCGAENREGARFCDACGTALTEASAARERRKTVTVLFCDLVGSTELSQKLDPEDLRALMLKYQEMVANVVGRYDGLALDSWLRSQFYKIHNNEKRCQRHRERENSSPPPLGPSFGSNLDLRLGRCLKQRRCLRHPLVV